MLWPRPPAPPPAHSSHLLFFVSLLQVAAGGVDTGVERLGLSRPQEQLDEQTRRFREQVWWCLEVVLPVLVVICGEPAVATLLSVYVCLL